MVSHDRCTGRTASASAAGGPDAFARSILDGLASHIAVVNAEGEIVTVNHAWRKFAECNDGDASVLSEGANYLDVCDAVSGDGTEHGSAVAQGIREVLRGERDHFYHEYPCHCPTEARLFIVRVTRSTGPGPRRAVITHENITERKQLENELSRRAYFDVLTGLPNRSLLHIRLQQALTRLKENADHRFALLFLDFDRFKIINDSLGHDFGDQLLIAIAQRLRAELELTDCTDEPSSGPLAARLGGDEFVVFLEALRSPAEPEEVAARLLEALRPVYQISDHELYSSASIGLVLSDREWERPEDVLRDADTAMYEAKRRGKNRYAIFDVSMRARVQRQMALENDLQAALGRDQFLLYYQPIVALEDGRMTSVEALVRWRHPRHGLLPPGEFIPLAEETGLIEAIGAWTLRQACRDFMTWRCTHPETVPETVNINVSRRELMKADLAEGVREILRDTGVEPSRVHLEITESAMLEDLRNGAEVLSALKELGLALDMDDFGSGDSSLASLHEFPIDRLKLAGNFTRQVSGRRDLAAVVHAVATLAENLELDLVAEQIETLDQLAAMQSLNCGYGQGFLLGRPAPLAEIMVAGVAGFRNA